jgi:hypothetical protein
MMKKIYFNNVGNYDFLKLPTRNAAQDNNCRFFMLNVGNYDFLKLPTGNFDVIKVFKDVGRWAINFIKKSIKIKKIYIINKEIDNIYCVFIYVYIGKIIAHLPTSQQVFVNKANSVGNCNWMQLPTIAHIIQKS